MNGILSGLLKLLCVLSPTLVTATNLPGKVTDGVTGRPIPGATVFVYWGHTAGPNYHGSYWWSCDGNSAAVTDAQGRYEISLPFATSLRKTGDRAPQIRVVAPGYYDDRLADGGSDVGSLDSVLRSLTFREHSSNEDQWSPSLMPFGNASVDAKLMALNLSTTDYSIGVQANDVCEKAKSYEEYKVALARARDAALCPDDGLTPQPPLAGLIQGTHQFVRPDLPENAKAYYTFLSRELIDPLVPQDGKVRIPALALANTCAWIRWQQADLESTPKTSLDPITLQVPVRDQSNGAALSDVPVRILWGLHTEHHPSGDGYIIDYSARRGLVSETNHDGYIELPISRAMIEEQGLAYSQYNEQFRYAVVPMTTGQVNFDSGPFGPDTQIDGRSLYERFFANIPHRRPSSEVGRISADEWITLVNTGDPSFAKIPLNAAEVWHPPSTVQSLMRLRVQDEQRTAKASGHRELVAIHTYPWQWPGLALLWRSFALLNSRVDVETDTPQWNHLVRGQLEDTFDQICTEPDQAFTPHDTWEALVALWWLETQFIGTRPADLNAQQRAAAWDHGMRCTRANESLTSEGPSSSDFQSHTLCSAWRSLRPHLGTAAIATVPATDKLKLDFSRRQNACPGASNNGAFQ